MRAPPHYIIAPSGYQILMKGSMKAPCFHPAPGPPAFLAFSDITSTTLNVSWGEPAAVNGVLRGYRVVYEPLEPVQGELEVRAESSIHGVLRPAPLEC